MNSTTIDDTTRPRLVDAPIGVPATDLRQGDEVELDFGDRFEWWPILDVTRVCNGGFFDCVLVTVGWRWTPVDPGAQHTFFVREDRRIKRIRSES